MAARADDPGALRQEAASLTAANERLAARSREALLELYAIESELARAEARLAALRERADELRRREARTRRTLTIARATLGRAEAQLATRLQQLYIEGDTDALAVLLGADSLEDAIETLEGLDSFARHDRAIVAQVKVARERLRAALATLEREQAELRAVTAEAEAARATLARARASRSAYLSRLAAERRLNDQAIVRLTSRAESIEAKAAQVTAESSTAPPAVAADGAPAPAPAPPAAAPGAAPAGGRTMTVVATGYSLQGTTATGMPTGWGVVAVDPAVIPLGTRMTIPGYGEGVAADTGSAVRGATIDLWFPTRAQALAWGRRTVTITLH